MKKSLSAIGLLAAIGSVQAQNVLLHVDDTAITFVSKGTLLYNGGGLQTRGTGTIENHGNVIVSGTTSDSFKTITTGGADKTEGSVTGNFINKLNEPTAYASVNVNSPSATPVYTYGQLYISGIPQANITGIVDQEFRSIKHGSYQQIGLPFYDKTASTLSAELGKTFVQSRYSQNEILWSNNSNTESTNFGLSSKFGVATPGSTYYMLGGLNLDVSNTTRTLKGRPLTDIGAAITLQNAAAGINFGPTGAQKNSYNEYYNSYIQDVFEIASGGTEWQGNFGRNIYSLANPFLTNLDLTNVAYNEPAANGDGVYLSTIYGIKLQPGTVTTNSGGTISTGPDKFVTFNAGIPTGDVDYMVIRPLGTFAIKLNDNTAADQLNFSNLRRFNYYSRSGGTDYNVNANKNNPTTNTVKQLGVIGLDANGNEVAKTYYVVYANGNTGHSTSSRIQVANSSSLIYTYEEAPGGGIDNNYKDVYQLYINEANESNFQGKNIVLKNSDLTRVKSYKFEVRENAQLINNSTFALSSGLGFYYNVTGGNAQPIKQGDIIPATTDLLNLYYDTPNTAVLATGNTVAPSKTIVVYNPQITNYIVRFDPAWKKADIEVYDMSGKLVISKKAVNTSTDFVIELDGKVKNAYIVKVVSDKGEVVNTKILK
ncbi:Por secretion system C-terminal sorting domain-containing protein [Chryseobacterium rhizoplanae]|uniref:Por secretion system C-terminal sorting domain-containing protein n=1 Tax=Chryseobacterium rhizoplanae TaxID=1609531 RepID=A0A521DLE1_9FLAO|nr:T9SS type A sorting domain-containing protein [Chryseobacterium rhizoplanae]SMO72544.1 Por secretion system C-terminal sorting domain-containing protein [Chryseobacterium rhizoplanae]